MTDAELIKARNMDRLDEEVADYLESLTFAEVEAVMMMLPDGGMKRTAKHCGSARPWTGKTDGGQVAKGAVKIEPRGLRGHRYRPSPKQRSTHAPVRIVRGESYGERAARMARLGTQADFD